MRVAVYFNLHKRCWSVKALKGVDRGRVIAHMETLALRAAAPKVSEAGRHRVLKTRSKNVHAYMTGELVPLEARGEPTHDLHYNPYRCGYFVAVDMETGVVEELKYADYAVLKTVARKPVVLGYGVVTAPKAQILEAA